MFEGFTTERIDVGDAELLVRHGGEGPPVLLLHGHPRTSATWHRVAPALVAAGFRVICPDLRGYGRSTGPDPTPDHTAHSKRAVAGDLARLMTALGHPTFAVAGHDRGSYVALRLTLDHPERVTRLAVLDGVPISEHLSRMGPEFATRWWHWFFFAQPDVPERVITADPDAWYRGDPAVMGADNHAEFRAATRDPRVVRAMLEDYRAGLTVDRRAEEADRAAGVRIRVPVLVLWSSRDDLGELYGDPVRIWADWADDVRGHAIDSGHHMAEEAPEALSAARVDFLAAAPAPAPSPTGPPGDTRPRWRQTVLDTTDARGLAEFYRELLGWRYRPGDERPDDGPDERGRDWLVLRGPGDAGLAFQQVADLPRPTWPDPTRPQQLHLDLTVGSVAELDAGHHRVLALGGVLLHDRADDPEEPLRVYADPAGHPFCLFVAPS